MPDQAGSLFPRTPVSQSQEGHSREEELMRKGVLHGQVSGGHPGAACGGGRGQVEMDGVVPGRRGHRKPNSPQLPVRDRERLCVSVVQKVLTKLLFVI